jgi:hypothetical protein
MFSEEYWLRNFSLYSFLRRSKPLSLAVLTPLLNTVFSYRILATVKWTVTDKVEPS